MADCAEPVQTTELVLLPKMAPLPPVARMMASAAKALEFHGAQVDGGDAAGCAFGVEDGGEKLPAFVLLHFAVGLVAADLLVERVEQLLAGGGAGKCGAVVERAAEAAEVEQALGRAVEGHAHAVEQVDDGRRGLAHGLDGRLVGEEVAAVDGVVEVLVGGVAFALEIFGGVDAALRADRVRALDGDDGKQVDGAAGFGDLDDCREPGQPSANHDDSGCCHVLSNPFKSQPSAVSYQPSAEARNKNLGTSEDWRREAERRRNPIPEIDLADGGGQECDFAVRKMR